MCTRLSRGLWYGPGLRGMTALLESGFHGGKNKKGCITSPWNPVGVSLNAFAGDGQTMAFKNVFCVSSF
ncbi:hypothetical protein FKM82_014516 [Ascaphus truei]